MSEADVVTLLRESIWLTIKLSTPVLLVGMVVGLIISILQTTTSIQEQTLTFVPKLIVTLLSIIVLAAWMVQNMTDYTKELFRMVARF
ncbi:MAG: flagellar biosynthesis protein FliQ [Leptospiraceae bacterium]|nr:flagellar biosynthesis protein FliQ [Leptospiraceae bacterium]MDW8306445.1 flagellar biosynthesis protein FliQ [Leptospiraceae bacterium]